MIFYDSFSLVIRKSTAASCEAEQIGYLHCRPEFIQAEPQTEVEHGRLMKWWVTKKTIFKGKVRSSWEVKGTLGLPRGTAFSERKTLAARFFGCVYLPNTMPDYEYLKKLAESWRTPEEMKVNPSLN